MTLDSLDPDPIPNEEDLRPFLKGKVAQSLHHDVERTLAEIQWRLDLRKRDSDAFLVAFSTEAFPALGFGTYDSYLKSDLWDTIKREELSKAGGICAACGQPTRTIHHRDYRPRVLLGEDRSPLIALCQPCHNHVHYGKMRRERSWNESEKVLRDIVERVEVKVREPD